LTAGSSATTVRPWAWVRAEGTPLTMITDQEAAVAAGLAQRIGTQRYELWFAGKTRLTIQEQRLKVGVPNRFYLDWLDSNFTPALREVWNQVLGQAGQVQLVIEPALFQASRASQNEPTGGMVKPAATPAPTSATPAKPSAPQRRFLQLGDFVVGPSNRLAHAAALNVLDAADAAGDPLTFYGPPGVGKTHLLEGVFAELRQRKGDASGLFVSAEEFTNRFLPAMHARQLGPFRKQFREAPALFVDDLHFFSGKEATQREFLHTFETLRKLGRVVAVTSACHPRQLPGFLPELADRLQAGGAWPIDLPDAETRRALLRAKSTRLGCKLPLEVLDFLSFNLRGNVRELEGALNSIHHYSQVQRQPIDVGLVRAAIGHLLQEGQRVVQLHDVEVAVCQALGLDRKTLQAKSRSRCNAYPRMLAMYIARRCTRASYAEIGHFFGRRNHRTVLAAEKKVGVWIENEEPFVFAERPVTWRALVEELDRKLRLG
jgi:chromosomal replication initiator protein